MKNRNVNKLMLALSMVALLGQTALIAGPVKLSPAAASAQKKVKDAKAELDRAEGRLNAANTPQQKADAKKKLDKAKLDLERAEAALNRLAPKATE